MPGIGSINDSAAFRPFNVDVKKRSSKWPTTEWNHRIDSAPHRVNIRQCLQGETSREREPSVSVKTRECDARPGHNSVTDHYRDHPHLLETRDHLDSAAGCRARGKEEDPLTWSRH
jgi:hypothetical protein